MGKTSSSRPDKDTTIWKNGEGDRQKGKEESLLQLSPSSFFLLLFPSSFFHFDPPVRLLKYCVPAIQEEMKGRISLPQPPLSDWENSRKSARCSEVWLEFFGNRTRRMACSFEYVREKACMCVQWWWCRETDIEGIWEYVEVNGSYGLGVWDVKVLELENIRWELEKNIFKKGKSWASKEQFCVLEFKYHLYLMCQFLGKLLVLQLWDCCILHKAGLDRICINLYELPIDSKRLEIKMVAQYMQRLVCMVRGLDWAAGSCIFFPLCSVQHLLFRKGFSHIKKLNYDQGI